ncbi:MAG: hypothetical protein F7C07_03405 [Desulfurococcales archaeon]|nr:hypothetical protein [Desulfurococcales archaeon]
MSTGLWQLQEAVGEAGRRAQSSGEWVYLRDRLSELAVKSTFFLKLLWELGVKEPEWVKEYVYKIRESVKAGDAGAVIDFVSRLEEAIDSKIASLWARAVHTRLVKIGSGAALSLLSFKAYSALLEGGPLLLVAVTIAASLGLASLLLIKTPYSPLLQAIAGLVALSYSAVLLILGGAASIYQASLIAGLAGPLSLVYARLNAKEAEAGIVG